MVTISGVSKRFGGRELFSEVSLQINRGDCIALVGPNGAGKTTLLSLILGHLEADEGTISIERSATIGFLPQESAPAGEETVLELAMAIHMDLADIKRKAAAAESGAKAPAAYDPMADYDHHDNSELEPKAKRILSGLSFRESDFHRPARELSGGWVMRAHLARLLVQEPDLLVLDEPTNHLDLESLQWFQEYLQYYEGGILMISHDREFLNALAGSIVDIRQGKANRYRGNYDAYIAQRAAQADQQLAAYKNQQREIARLQEFADRFRAKASKAAQAQSKLKQIERMDLVEAPVDESKKISFQFPQPQRSGLKVITLTGVRHAYGANVVYDHLDFEAERGQRVVLVGPNGAGKSTLLKVLAGVLPVQSGLRELGFQAKAGYYSQYRVDMLQPSRTVFDEALDTPQRVTEQSVRTLLGCFLFRGDDVFKRVSVLSGGEKSRLALVKLLLDPPNLLLMDEPTTHLDMPSIDALVEALKQFQGTLVFISHDVYFIRALANRVVRVQSGRLTNYPGDYQYYLDKTNATNARAALVSGDKPVAAAPAQAKPKASEQDRDRKRAEADARQARAKLRQTHQKRASEVERQLADTEARRAALIQTLEAPDTYGKPGKAMEIHRELMHIEETITRLTQEWEEVATKLGQLEAEALAQK